MVQVDLITGFLGAGKTTFLRRYAAWWAGQGVKVCVLENDFGAVNVPFRRNAGSSLQKFDAAVLDVVHRTDDPQARFLLDVMDAQTLFDLLHTVPDVETAGLVGVCFVPDGLLDLVRDVADIAGGLGVDGGIHRTAVGVAQHHHQPTAQMAGSVLDAAQLVVVDDVARQPDDEQLTDARREDVLRDDPGIRTGDDDGVGRLALCPCGHPDTAG